MFHCLPPDKTASSPSPSQPVPPSIINPNTLLFPTHESTHPTWLPLCLTLMLTLTCVFLLPRPRVRSLSHRWPPWAHYYVSTLVDDGPGLLEMNVGKRATLDCLEDSGTIQLGLT